MALLAALILFAAPGDTTPEDVHFFIRAYAVWYASEQHPYTVLIRDVERVAQCESRFSPDVINNRRLGRAGEVGVGQWLPGGIWNSTPQAKAGYSVYDAEANTAGLVWAISREMGPLHWSCW